MIEIKYKDLKLPIDYQVFTGIEPVLERIKRGEFFCVKNYELENFADSLVKILYTSNEEPVLYASGGYTNYMHKDFFEEYKEVIVKERKKYILDNIDNLVTITPEVMDDEFFNILVKRASGKAIFFKNVRLTNEQITLLQQNFVDAAMMENNGFVTVSNSIILGNLKYEDLKNNTKKNIKINYNLTDRELENLKYIKSNMTLEIKNIMFFEFFKTVLDDSDRNELVSLTEEEYYLSIKKILDRLIELKINIQVKFMVYNQATMFKILNETLIKYPNIMVNYDLNEYKITVLQEDEVKLNNMINSIKNSSLSPFEKFLAVYNLVKKYKLYKENEESPNEARYIHNILNNDYMVCVGYSKLLIDLLSRVGISSEALLVDVDVSEDSDFVSTNLTTSLTSHERVFLYLKDDKYDIDGYYVSDPTWDNSLDIDLYNNSLITLFKTRESKRMQKLNNFDLLFDVSSMDEFILKFNYLFKKEVSLQFKISNIDDVISRESIFLDIIDEIMLHFFRIDKSSFEAIKQNYISAFTLKNEKYFYEFLYKAGLIILSKTNKEIKSSKYEQALLNINKTLNTNYFLEDYELMDEVMFPYKIDKDTQMWRRK